MKKSKIRDTLAYSILILFLCLFLVSPDYTSNLNFLSETQLLQAALLGGYKSLKFIAVIVLTLIFGRVYCSILCPMGTTQELITKLKKVKYKYHESSYTQLIIVITIIISMLAGVPILIAIFDPYSNFGRIITNILGQVLFRISFINSSEIFNSTNTIYLSSLFTLYAVMFVVFLIISGVFRGRYFCHSVCPVGFFLKSISKISFFNLKLNSHKCINCGLCEQNCNAEAVNLEEKEIEYDKCLLCFKCEEICPTNAIEYKTKFDKSTYNDDRRSFVKRLSASIFSLTALGFLPIFRASFSKKSQIIPPGAINVNHYRSKCTACHLCVTKCPVGILDGSGFQPFLNYNKGYCQYECNVCAQVCPSDAIAPISLEDKKTTQIGKVKFIKNKCIVFNNETACGACSEHCPTKAVYMIKYIGELRIPETDADLCIGCGACEHKCPVDPKAIIVNPNDKHQKVTKIAKESDSGLYDDIKISADDDFPF